MNKTKLMLTLVLAFAFLFAQVGNVAAAPAQQGTTSITGTVTQVTCQTDSTGTNTFTVTLDTTSGSQTVTIDQATAISLGLVTADSTGTVDCASDAVTQELSADAGKTVTVTPTPTTTEEPTNPISTLLGAFFGVDASTIDGWHQDGTGFGVIAQALWMSKNLDGAISAEDILQAKKDGSGTFTLADGTVITYTNWGQFKKQLLEKHNNLGNVVSGHANDENQPGKGNGNGNGQGNGGNGKGNGQGNGNGHKP